MADPKTDVSAALKQDIQLLQQALTIANRAVISDIECNCVRLENVPTGRPWFDTRPMVDPREHAPESLDMATQALAYAEASGLIERNPQYRHLVRITAAGRAVA